MSVEFLEGDFFNIADALNVGLQYLNTSLFFFLF